MTNENRIYIYEDTIDKIKENEDWFSYKEAIIYNEQYDFTIPIVKYDTKFIVADIDSFEAIRMFNLEEEKTCVLNFANAYLPGGGVLKGYVAQEEELCRRSSLHLSLMSEEARPFYENNNQCKCLFNDNSLILSPKVLVIKDKNYDLLREPIKTSVLTMPAPNIMSIQAKALKKDLFMLFDNDIGGLEFKQEISKKFDLVIEKKMSRILGCMLEQGYQDVILGAWGAGSFGHNAFSIAKLFKKVINTRFEGCFRTIVFAVLDNTDEKIKLKSFRKVFDKGDENDEDISSNSSI